MKPTRIVTDPAELRRLIENQPPVSRERAIASIRFQNAMAAVKRTPPSNTFRCK